MKSVRYIVVATMLALGLNVHAVCIHQQKGTIKASNAAKLYSLYKADDDSRAETIIKSSGPGKGKQ